MSKQDDITSGPPPVEVRVVRERTHSVDEELDEGPTSHRRRGFGPTRRLRRPRAEPEAQSDVAVSAAQEATSTSYHQENTPHQSLWLRLAQVLLRCFIVLPLNLISRPKWLRIGSKYQEEPVKGFRKKIYDWTNGRWNFGNTKRYRKAESVRIITRRKPFKCVVIATIAFGGGVGKTTIGLLIARVLRAVCKAEKILIIDLNPSSGTLKERSGAERGEIQAVIDGRESEACWTIEDVYRNLSKLNSAADINYRLASEDGIFVLAGEVFGEGKARFEGVDIEEVIDHLKEYFDYIVLDCGTNDQSNPASAYAMRHSDAIVIPTTIGKDRLKQVANLMRSLEGSEYRDKLVVVFNKVWRLFNFRHRRTDRAMDNIKDFLSEEGTSINEFQGRIRVLPWSIFLATGQNVSLEGPGRGVQVVAHEITAAALQVVFDQQEHGNG